MAFCTHCGHNIPGHSQFCPDCGVAVLTKVFDKSTETTFRSTFPSKTTTGVAAAADPAKIAPKFVLLIIALIGGFGVAIVLATTEGISSKGFQSAVDSCVSFGDDGYEDIQVSDDGKSMFLDGSGENDYSSLGVVDQVCILAQLDVPEIIITRMNATNALMGAQTGEWDGITASWTYHPNNGLDVSLSRK
jgi:hypothetical protein